MSDEMRFAIPGMGEEGTKKFLDLMEQLVSMRHGQITLVISSGEVTFIYPSVSIRVVNDTPLPIIRLDRNMNNHGGRK